MSFKILKKSWGTYKRLHTNGQNQSGRYSNMPTFDSYGWKLNCLKNKNGGKMAAHPT